MNPIFKRRSIRKFTNKSISEKQLEMLLRAGMAAPSAHNKQPWQFIVATKRDILDKLASKHPYAKMLYEAPLCIIVCADKNKQEVEGLYVQDASASMENMLLEAVTLELGAVWIALYPYKEHMDLIRETFNVPEEVLPISMMAVGNPSEFKHDITRYKEELVHMDIY